MHLTSQICYQALRSHDRRFDGLFFTCVSSTGIYCRPICPAVLPSQHNCVFVATAAEAEKTGYRPCLRCRPEQAPADRSETGSSPAHRLAAHIDETLLMDESLAEVARLFKISDRHLRRLFKASFGTEPHEYLTTRRLLFAKQLLQDTELSVAQVAYAAGFNTPGRLTINMKRAYGFTPERLRQKPLHRSPSHVITLQVDYRPPLHWSALLEFLQGRATPHEWVAENAYHRLMAGHEIVVTHHPQSSSLRVQLPAELSPQAHPILARVRRLFDLDANPLVIAAALAADPFMADLVHRYPGLRVPGCWDNFEMLLRVIVGQQVSVAGATTVMRRLVDRIGATPAAIAASTPEQIAALGMPLKRATTIWTIGTLVHQGKLNLDERDPQIFYNQLIAIPGIGPWTAEYLRMRVLRWPDAFPAGDLGLQKAAMPGQRQTERQLATQSLLWQPWRSYATIMLWKSLDNQGG